MYFIGKLKRLLALHPNLIKAVQAKSILEALDIGNSSIYLDVGCATGRQFVSFAKKVSLAVGADINESSLISAKKLADMLNFDNIHLVAVDGVTFPFKSRSFDRILCADVISIASEPIKLLREVMRMLKDDGKVVICNGRGYKTIDRFYSTTNIFFKDIRRLLTKLHLLPGTRYGFYKRTTARNMSLGEFEFNKRYNDLDGYLEGIINETNGFILERKYAFCEANEFIMSVVLIFSCIFRLPSRVLKYLLILFVPAFLIFERLFLCRAGLASIYVVGKER